MSASMIAVRGVGKSYGEHRVLDEEQSHPGPLRFIGRTVSACKCVHARVHHGSHADG